MGFGQLIKYNERNIFLKNYTPRMVNLIGLTSQNMYYYCLNLNRVTIYRAKCHDSDFKSFTNKFFPLWLGGKKCNTLDSENEDKQNWTFLCKFRNKMFKRFREDGKFLKSFYSYISKHLHIHFNPSQNLSPFILLNGYEL